MQPRAVRHATRCGLCAGGSMQAGGQPLLLQEAGESSMASNGARSRCGDLPATCWRAGVPRCCGRAAPPLNCASPGKLMLTATCRQPCLQPAPLIQLAPTELRRPGQARHCLLRRVAARALLGAVRSAPPCGGTSPCKGALLRLYMWAQSRHGTKECLSLHELC